MRVTHVITRLVVGGAQENTLSSVLGLAQTPGWTIDLISGPTYGPEGSLEPLLSQYPHFHKVPSLVRPVHPINDVRAYFHLRSLFRKLKPDIVHTHSGKAGILGRFAASAEKIPIIIHGIHGPSFGTFQNRFANAIFKNVERLAGHKTSHFVSVANAMTDQYLAAGIGRPEDFTTVYSGFNLQPFLDTTSNPELRKKLELSQQDIVILKIARLSPLKGHDDILKITPELIAKEPRIKFIFLGNGMLRENFENQIRTQGLENHFRFPGLVPPSEVCHYVAASDFVIHLSRREGLARALPQALAGGKPVISYDCDGAREVCIDGQTGFLIPMDDLNFLKTRIYSLGQNVDLRKKMGMTGQRLVEQKFTIEKMVNDLRLLYQRLTPVKG